MSAFARLHPRLQRAIVDRLGWRGLRPVQEEAAEVVLDGRNAVVLAPTAGGKTEAALFPVLSRLLEEPTTRPGALYIAPIKALLNNQEERLGMYAEMVGLRAFKWHGDTTQSERRQWLREPGELVLITPESLEVLLVSTKVPAAELFSQLRYIVVDEVHAFAGSDRGAHLAAVIERLALIAGRDLVRIGLSATVGNPADILTWLTGSSKRGGAVVDPKAPPPRREVLIAHPGSLSGIARDAVRLARGQKSLCFAESRAMTETIADQMTGGGVEVLVHHSSVSKEERARAEEQFARGRNTCIVCTSTLELGIDVGDLDRVIQINAPRSVASLLQRIGRTGRREGRPQSMVFLCESGMAALQAAALLRLVARGWVETVPQPRRMWHVLAHQLLAWTLQHETLVVEEAWATLKQVQAFSGFDDHEVKGLVAHLVETRLFDRVGAHLVLGTEAERRFGRRNFLELYSVFSSPQVFIVKTANGRELGVLDEDFVEQLFEDMSNFLLGGSAWSVIRIDRSDRVVHVAPAPYGVKPGWGGHAPILLGRELGEEMRAILVDSPEMPFVHASAAQAIQTVRDEYGSTLAAARGMTLSVDELRWNTFAGGRVNQTLRLALAHLGGWKVVADNYGVAVRGAGVTIGEVTALLPRLADAAWWRDTRGELFERLPGYRVSKFQHLLPVEAQREIVADMLLDVEGTIDFVRSGATHGAERR